MFENLSKETLEKVRQAKTKEEALKLLKENGITLSDEDLINVGGGAGSDCYMYNPCTTDENCPTDCLIFSPFCDINTCPIHSTCPDYCNLDQLPCIRDAK